MNDLSPGAADEGSDSVFASIADTLAQRRAWSHFKRVKWLTVT